METSLIQALKLTIVSVTRLSKDALLAEALDLRDDIASLGHWRWAASLHDVLNTIFWPSVMTVLVRFRVLRWGQADD